MVQITHAAFKDPQTGKKILGPDGTPLLARADSFDKLRDAQSICVCPDKDCMAELSHYVQHDRTFYDDMTGAPFQLTVAAHFQRKPGSPLHRDGCAAVWDDQTHKARMRALGALEQLEGVFIFNNNIPRDENIERPRHPSRARPVLREAFQRPIQKAADEGITTRPPLSQGINHVRELGRLLDETHFDVQKRDSIYIRYGHSRRKLEAYYHEKPSYFFKELFLDEGRGTGIAAGLVYFSPIKSAQFHNPKERTIEGVGERRIGKDGHGYYVSYKLHCASDKIYQAVRRGLKEGAASYLVDSRKCWVDMKDSREKIKAVSAGQGKGKTLFVHVYIGNEAQFCPWTPKTTLDLHLPLQQRPPKASFLPPQSQLGL